MTSVRLVEIEAEVGIDRHGFDRYRRTLLFVSADGEPVGDVLMREGLPRKWVQTYNGQEEPWCQADISAALKAGN